MKGRTMSKRIEVDPGEAFGKHIQTITFANTKRIILQLEDGLMMDFSVEGSFLALTVYRKRDLATAE